MLQLHLLGAPAVMRDGRPVTGAAAQPRRLAVLAMVALGGARGITRDKLIATLWSDSDDEKARRALTNALYALRRDLGAEQAIDGLDTLRLEQTFIASDVERFARSRAEGRLADAAAVYDGPLMDGFHVPDAPEFERWLDDQRTALSHDYAALLEALAKHALESGDPHAATGWWRRRAAEDPLNARIAISLMEALDRAGDRAGALRHAQIHEELVRQELALPPDREVAAFAARLRSAPPASPVPPASAGAPAPAVEHAPVSQALTDAPTISPAHSSEPGPAPRPARRSAPPWWLAAAALVALAAAVVWYRGRSASGEPRIAVGHVADYRSGDSALSGPITDLLATNLARVPNVAIVSTGRLYELLHASGGSDTGAAGLVGAARRAGAGQIIEGALYTLPDGRLRLDLRRTDLGSGQVLGAQRVEAADVFALVDSGTARLARDIGGAAPGGSVADVTTRSESAARLYEEGLRRYHGGERAAAEPLFAQALRQDSLFAMAAFYHALTATDFIAQLSRMNRAVALSTSASDRERWLIRGTYASWQRDPRLIDYAESLATRYPTEIEGHLFLGRALVERGDFLAGVPALRRAIAMAGGPAGADRRCPDCEAWGTLTAAYHLADSLPAAVRAAREWSARRPDASQAWAALGEVLEASGAGDSALEAFRRASGVDPAAASPLLLLAAHRIWTADYAGAERTLREQIEAATPAARTDALWLLALALRQEGRLREALDATRRMRAAAPGLPGPRGSVPAIASQEAQVLLEMGRAGEAAALFDSVGHWSVPLQAPASRDRSRVWWMTHAAESWIAAGDTARAAAVADTIQSLGATSQYGRDQRLHHYVRGLLWLRRGQKETAVSELRAAMYSPTLGFTRTNSSLARTLLELGRPREAIAVLQPALRGGLEASNLYITRTELHSLLGEAWDAAGVRDSARAHWSAVARAWSRAEEPFATRAAAAQARAR